MTFVATDLHGHTCFSDARATPEEYVRFRAKIRMEVVALSDHDTFAGVRRAADEAKRHGLVLVPAMETTSFVAFGTPQAEQIHVLAYFPPAFLDDGHLERTALHARALRVAGRWKEYVLSFLAGRTDEDRAALDVERLSTTPPEDFPQLQTLITTIVEKRPSLYEHFQLDHVHFWEDRALFGWTPEECMEQIRADGGFDVVAHPVRARDKERMERATTYAQGIEAYTSRHRPEIAARFRAWAEERGKHWTASADDHQHGPYLRPHCGTPKRTVDRILRGADA